MGQEAQVHPRPAWALALLGASRRFHVFLPRTWLCSQHTPAGPAGLAVTHIPQLRHPTPQDAGRRWLHAPPSVREGAREGRALRRRSRRTPTETQPGRPTQTPGGPTPTPGGGGLRAPPGRGGLSLVARGSQTPVQEQEPGAVPPAPLNLLLLLQVPLFSFTCNMGALTSARTGPRGSGCQDALVMASETFRCGRKSSSSGIIV